MKYTRYYIISDNNEDLLSRLPKETLIQLKQQDEMSQEEMAEHTTTEIFLIFFQ